LAAVPAAVLARFLRWKYLVGASTQLKGREEDRKTERGFCSFCSFCTHARKRRSFLLPRGTPGAKTQ
jgi:hypothetical protein